MDGTQSAEETRLNKKIGIQDKGFEIVPMKFCSSTEYKENRSLIVNFSTAFQLIPSILGVFEL